MSPLATALTRRRRALAILAIIVGLGIAAAGIATGIHAQRTAGARTGSYTAGQWSGRAFLLGVGGLLFWSGLSKLLRATGESARRGRATVIVVFVGAGLAVIALVGASGGRMSAGEVSDSFDSPAGRFQRTHFLTVCRASTAGRVDCVCYFNHLTAHAPYNTIHGFRALSDLANRLARTNPHDIPPVIASAALACTAGAVKLTA